MSTKKKNKNKNILFLEDSDTSDTGENQVQVQNDYLGLTTEIKFTLDDFRVMEMQEIKNILGGISPIHIDLYRQAMVHKSISIDLKYFSDPKEIPKWMTESNEILELLGDAVFTLVITDYLTKRFPKHNEAFITRTKIKLIRSDRCAEFARFLGLREYIIVSNRLNIDTNSDKILEDVFEAFLGALYRDYELNGDYNNPPLLIVSTFVHRLLDRCIDFDNLLLDDNYKDILLRYSKSKNINLEFNELKREGKSNKFIFTVEVSMKIDDKLRKCIGKGKSKKSAEQEASYGFIRKVNNRELNELVERDLNSCNLYKPQNSLI